MQYMGSKNRYAKYIVPIIQKYIDDNDCKKYLEPFVGGANIIDKVKCEKRIGCDLNEYLIALLKEVSKKHYLPLNIDEQTYIQVKNNIEKYQPWQVGHIGFCGSFGAKFFNGFAKGNDKRNRFNEATKNLLKQSYNIEDVNFCNFSFQDIPKDKIKGYVIYCDPPYRGTTKYKTDEFPYEEYYDWCREMSKDNIVLCSEYWMPDDFECIWSKETTTQINSKRQANDEKNKRVEKLFVIEKNVKEKDEFILN